MKKEPLNKGFSFTMSDYFKQREKHPPMEAMEKAIKKSDKRKKNLAKYSLLMPVSVNAIYWPA